MSTVKKNENAAVRHSVRSMSGTHASASRVFATSVNFECQAALLAVCARV